jgi:hypothetical protein
MEIGRDLRIGLAHDFSAAQQLVKPRLGSARGGPNSI